MSIFRAIKRFRLILSSHQKLRIIELAFLMIVGGLLETLSVSLILPFMDVVMNPEETMSKSYVSVICEVFGIDSHRSFLVFIAIALAVIYLFKNVYLVMEYNVQYRFVYGNMFMMQQRMLENFINKPYEHFLNISSGDVIRIINDDTPQVFVTLVNLLSMFTELVVSAMLILAIFLIAPKVTVFMALVLGVMVIIIDSILRPLMNKAGKERQLSGSGMNKWLLQSIQGIKELKVSCKEKIFKNEYNRYGWRYVNSIRVNNVLSIIPRFFLEAICMCTVFLFIAIYIYSGADIETMIPVLSAVAVAAMRLLPSVNRISSAAASISYCDPMLDKLIESMRNITEEGDGCTSKPELVQQDDNIVPSLKEKLDFCDISYKYPTGDTEVLSNAFMEIQCGQSVGIVGPSGAGKTTAVDILLGLLVPQNGQVLVDGINIASDMQGWLSQIGYIPQQIFMLDDTIRSNVAFGEKDISDEKVWKALSEAALDEFVKELPDGLDTEIGERGMRLSGGQRQRIGIARALYKDPDILFFDEATSALDKDTESEIMESVNRLHGKKTLVIIAHRLSTIENCDVVYRVENGKIHLETSR